MVVLAVFQLPTGDKTPPQHIQNTTDSTHKPTYVTQLQANSSTRPISKTELKPIKFIHGEPTIEFTMDEVNEFSIEEGLHQVVILKFSYGKPDLHELPKVLPKQLNIKAVGKPIVVDKATQERTRPSTARVKVILDLLDKYPKEIKLFFVDKDSSKRQGHDENSCHVFLGKVGAKIQNDATDKGTDVEQYQGDARELINAKFQSKSNKEEQRQLVPDDNSSEGRDSRNNLVVVRDATVDRAVANSSEEATIFNSNNEENLENKGKSIEAARRGVGKDGVLGSPNVVASKQDNSTNEWTLILHQNNCTYELDRSNIVIECPQFDVLRDENVG
ncbi:hypothetical protein KY290_030890 [Solanum tuberosum]|uniref:Uncharacterized protein n=1 Tax=Solanum tuberosum TaxID=4113 RepID=A0ABQ7U7L6_SOLTU|nr:hypothetical protein KY290_030890 [Solanum tuberosum]